MNNNTIEKLVNEIKELINQIDLKISEYDSINTKITEIEETNNKLKEELDKNNFIFHNTIEWKYYRWVFLISLIISGGTFTFFSFNSVNESGFLVKILLSILVSYPFFAIGHLSNNIFKRQIQTFCIKKYPEIKEIFDKVNSLKNSIMLNDRKLSNLKEKREVLLLEIDSNKYMLDSKKLELAQFEEKGIKENPDQVEFCFDNIECKNKRRVRVPNKNENLDV